MWVSFDALAPKRGHELAQVKLPSLKRRDSFKHVRPRRSLVLVHLASVHHGDEAAPTAPLVPEWGTPSRPFGLGDVLRQFDAMAVRIRHHSRALSIGNLQRTDDGASSFDEVHEYLFDVQYVKSKA